MADMPSMPLFPDAYLGATSHLTLEEHGAYCLLLMHMWLNRGYVYDNDRDNARRLGVTPRRWRVIKGRLAPFLFFSGTGKDARISQKRLQIEWNKVREFRELQSERGKRSGKVRGKQKQSLNMNHGSSTVHGSVKADNEREGEPESNGKSNSLPNIEIKQPTQSKEPREKKTAAPSPDPAAPPDGAQGPSTASGTDPKLLALAKHDTFPTMPPSLDRRKRRM